MPPCRRTPLSPDDIGRRLARLGAPWRVCENTLRAEWRFKDFSETAAFVRAVLQIARRADHHPQAEFGFHYCKIIYTTHSAGALTPLDFYCAGRLNAAAKK